MNSITRNLCIAAFGLLLMLPVNGAGQSYIVAEDEAFHDAYNDGWKSGIWSGNGFGAWQLFAPEYTSEGEEQYAGFFIADEDREGDLHQAARKGKAFGIFANGTGFEETVAFRSFSRPLEPGDVFSLRFLFGGFSDRFENESVATSSVGLALRMDAEATSLADLSKGRAMVLAALEGLSTYQVLDAEPRFNTRIFLDPEGVEVGITIRDNNRYDLQLITLSDNKVHIFPNRLFRAPESEDGETQPVEIQSFALFNLNGGDRNAYYGAFQVTGQE